MNIAWVGGMDRSEGAYAQVARGAGHEIERHSGRLHGRGTGQLRRAVERADVVIVVTDLNSHGAVELARRCARETATPLVLLQRCGIARFRKLLETLELGPVGATA